MNSVDLTFIQRLKLTDLLSKQEGPLGKTAPFLRILEKVRFTDDEDSQIIRTPVSDTIVNYSAPDKKFGKLTVELESADAIALGTLLESWQNFTTLDHWWSRPLLDALKH